MQGITPLHLFFLPESTLQSHPHALPNGHPSLLKDIQRKEGCSIMLITHDLGVIAEMADYVVVMYAGRVIETGTTEEIFENPMHPYTKSLLSAIPLPDPEYEKNRQRIVYNPLAEHDYSVDKPSLREVCPGHFVYCNDAAKSYLFFSMKSASSFNRSRSRYKNEVFNPLKL